MALIASTSRWASAGNYGANPLTQQVGYAGISSPGNARSAITVGALKTFDTATLATTACPTIARAARSWFDGFAKRYTLFPALRHTIAGRAHLTLTGTSMAAGVVSGSVALMIEEAKATFGAAPPVSAMKAMLQVSAFPMKSSGSVADQLDTIDPGNIQLSDNPLIASGVCSKGRD